MSRYCICKPSLVLVLVLALALLNANTSCGKNRAFTQAADRLCTVCLQTVHNYMLPCIYNMLLSSVKKNILITITYSMHTSQTKALVSQNASLGQLTEFSCTTRSSNDDISWSTVPDGILISPSTIPLAGGQKRSVLQLLATPENNNTVVRCVITDVLTGNATIRVATLMVQGNHKLFMHCK